MSAAKKSVRARHKLTGTTSFQLGHSRPAVKMIGMVVRAMREEYGWTRNRCADEAGVSYTTVERLETFQTRSPHLRTVILILEALGFRITVGRVKE